MIYEADGSLWRVSSAGTPALYLAAREDSSIQLSEDRTHSLVLEPDTGGHSPSTEYLVDVVSGDRHQVWPLPDGESCPFTFVEENPTYLATTLLPEGRDPGYDCDRGSPAFLPVAGGSLLVLDPARSSQGSWAISPDGRQVAFDKAGQPWTYSFRDGPSPLSPAHFGFPVADGDRFFSPSWSPESNLLAWDFISEANDRQGVVIFDVANGTHSTVEHLEVGRWEVCQGDIRWSRDADFLSVSHCELSYSVIATLAGEVLRRTDYYTGVHWAPSGHSFISHFDIQPLSRSVLAYAADPTAIPLAIGEARFIRWFDDSHVLIERDDSYYVLDLQNWQEDRLALPDGAILRYYP